MKSLLVTAFKDLVETASSGEPPITVFNLRDSSSALFLKLMQQHNRSYSHFLVTGTEEEAERLRKEVTFYQKILGGRVPLYLPDPEGIDSTGIRLENILNLKKGDLLIGSAEAFLSSSWTSEELSARIIELFTDSSIQRKRLCDGFQSLGYRKAPLVSEKGEFSERGWVIDIFPSNMDRPVRIEFFGDEIESLRTFEIDTQRSVDLLKDVRIFPAEEKREGPLVIDLLKSDGLFYYTENAVKKISGSQNFPPGVLLNSLSMKDQLEAPVLPLSGSGFLHHERRDIFGLITAVRNLQDAGKSQPVTSQSRDLVSAEGSPEIVFVLSSKAQAKRTKEVLQEGEIVAPVVPLDSLAGYSGKIAITVGYLSEGLHIPGLIILTEKELFGKRPLLKTYKASKVRKLLDRIEDLSPGDYIVHSRHGIGRFSGLENLTTSGHEGEVMVIEYAEGARLLLPLHNIGQIQKYRAQEGVAPSLDKLGGSQWKKKKERTRRKIRQIAEKLISVYAYREISDGFAFSPDTELHKEFEEFFPHQETPDQLAAWRDIKKDMESPKPMDRLLCGDVGYGKTEIAMRAAFKAVFDGKQVAVLVPTTILAEQQFRNFKARFSAFPVRIDFLSRFKTRSEARETIKGIENGDIEIIIGTHSLLSKKVRFYDLGLLIIDEEHRFGVGHKERIKEIKKKVDCLTLSATPIPRTLEMSLSGIREMSLIETPPEERIAIKSYVTVFNEAVIKEAIERELGRGGQVFFVHNRVKDIHVMREFLQRIAPGANIEIGHGQMKEKELEDVMLRFMDGEIDILLATSIIGSGIDIPTANTIFINRAERMGLADLYQLKGRVGRSNLRAYAFFLIPPPHTLTEEARSRIKAIEELNYLGAGLRLALKDLEIRGAGNLLGPEQSGHIHAVGFDMYMDMLKKEVASLKGTPIEEEIDPRIDLRITAYIPESYIADTTLRLSLYRRLSLCRSEGDVDSIAEEMRDRFGRTPEPVKGLLDLIKIRVMAMKLKIISIVSQKRTVRVRFSHDTQVGVEQLLECERIYREIFTLDKDGFFLKGHDNQPELIKILKKVLNFLFQVSSGDSLFP